MSDTMLMLVVAECKGPVERCDGDLKAKLRASMDAAKNHFMVLDLDTQFRGAVGAVMSHYGAESEEYKRLAAEVETLRKFNAFLQAAQSGLNVEPPELSSEYEPIGLMGMWHDATKAKP